MSGNKSKYFLRVTRQSQLWPDFVAGSVADIDILALKSMEISCLILDIDDTLMEYRGQKVHPAIAARLGQIREAGIELMIGSNTRRDISAIANSIGATTIKKKWWHSKPMGRFFDRLLRSINLPPDRVVMVGDRIINDVIGANRVGLHTILVEPINRKTSWLSRWYRARVKRYSTKIDKNVII